MKLMMQATQVAEQALMHWPWLLEKQWLHYLRRVEQEADEVGLRPQERILCIGAGALPFTALALAQLSNAPVDAIDHQPELVARGQHWLRQRECQHLVCLRCAEGRCVTASDYTLVHIAAQAAPQAAILSHLWPQLAAGSRILVRLPHPWLAALYEGLPAHTRSTSACQVFYKTRAPTWQTLPPGWRTWKTAA